MTNLQNDPPIEPTGSTPVRANSTGAAGDLLHLISFSGGKDSVATWLHLSRNLEMKNLLCVFCDTAHEAKRTYDYLDYLQSKGCPIVRIHAIYRDLREHWPEDADPQLLDSQLTMEGLAIHKKRFPSPTRRFCTTFLKLMPLRRFRRSFSEPLVMVSGVRSDESPKRAALQPRHYDEFMEAERWLPIHSWSVEQVFACHAKHGIDPNPLYKQGCGRVGCFPCIMARKPELKAIARYSPETFDKLAAMEKRVAKAAGKKVMTWFSRTKVPLKYRSVRDPRSKKLISTAMDVKRWALDQPPIDAPPTLDLYFHDDPSEDLDAPACSSPYGLCE